MIKINGEKIDTVLKRPVVRWFYIAKKTLRADTWSVKQGLRLQWSELVAAARQAADIIHET